MNHLKNHFLLNFKDFITQGISLLKIDENVLLEDFLKVEHIEKINVLYIDYLSIIQCILDGLLQKRKTSIIHLEITYNIFNRYMFKYRYLNNRQYFEFMSWAQIYIEIMIQYTSLDVFLQYIWNNKDFETTLKISKEYSQRLMYYISEKKTYDELIMEILNNDLILDFIKIIPNYKLDFSGSGQILTSILINDKHYLSFSGVCKEKDTKTGYDQLLELYKIEFDKNANYCSISTFLELISFKPLQQHVKDMIFSRSLVKNDLMVKGYSGTLEGSSRKIEQKIKNLLLYNGYPIYDENTNHILIRSLSLTSRQIAKQLNLLIESNCPAISELYLRLIYEIAQWAKNNRCDLIIPNNITTYVLQPKKMKLLLMKLTKLVDKKWLRATRRKIAYFSNDTDFSKLKNALGANIIQGVESQVCFYIKRIVIFLNPQLYIASIFDAFIFSAHLSPEIFRNVSRLACQLAFKHDIIKELLKINKIPPTSFYNQFGTSIFSSFNNNNLEKIINSDFLYYLFCQQDHWFNGKNELNNKILLKSIKFLNNEEKIKYNTFMKKMPNLSKKKTRKLLGELEQLKELYTVKFIVQEIYYASIILYNNFYTNNSNTVIQKLKNVMNSDSFIKF